MRSSDDDGAACSRSCPWRASARSARATTWRACWRRRPTTCATATSWSSPRRSCRRPRPSSCPSTPTTPRARRNRRGESVRVLRRRGDLIIARDPARLRLRQRRRRPVQRRGRLGGAPARGPRPLGPPAARRPPGPARRRGRRGHQRHVRPGVAPGPHRRRHRLRRHPRHRRPAGHDRRAGPRAAGHRGVRGRRAGRRRRAGDGQGDGHLRRGRPGRRPAWLGRGEVRAEVVRPADEDLFRWAPGPG